MPFSSNSTIQSFYQFLKLSHKSESANTAMSTARHIIALLKSHIEGEEQQFYSAALQMAAHEARAGHGKLAQDIRELIDQSKVNNSSVERKQGPVPLVQPKGELANLLSARYPDTRLSDMVLLPDLSSRLKRILTEQRQQKHLQAHNLTPRKKILLVGPPGSGKTMTASALAGELQLPLFTALYDTLIGKFMGETAIRLKLIFDSMVTTRGVYFFDEFDAIGAQRNSSNDVGEIRRVLNSFLLFLENDESESLIIASTNHPDLLDKALFRCFDDVLEYKLPDPEMIPQLIKCQLLTFDIEVKDWSKVISTAKGLSQAEIVRASGESAKLSVLSNSKKISEKDLLSSLLERKDTNFWLPKGA